MEVMVKHTAQVLFGCISAHAGHSPFQPLSQDRADGEEKLEQHRNRAQSYRPEPESDGVYFPA